MKELLESLTVAQANKWAWSSSKWVYSANILIDAGFYSYANDYDQDSEFVDMIEDKFAELLSASRTA